MKASEFSSELSKLIDNFAETTIEKTQKVQDEVVKEAVEELKSTSPKGNYSGGGKYAESWASRTTSKSRTGKTVTIYNKRYQLAHLLEYGHLTRNGTDRAEAFPHIAPVEAKLEEKCISRLKNEL